jgi:hypothetical protein
MGEWERKRRGNWEENIRRNRGIEESSSVDTHGSDFGVVIQFPHVVPECDFSSSTKICMMHVVGSCLIHEALFFSPSVTRRRHFTALQCMLIQLESHGHVFRTISPYASLSRQGSALSRLLLKQRVTACCDHDHANHDSTISMCQ